MVLLWFSQGFSNFASYGLFTRADAKTPRNTALLPGPEYGTEKCQRQVQAPGAQPSECGSPGFGEGLFLLGGFGSKEFTIVAIVINGDFW